MSPDPTDRMDIDIVPPSDHNDEESVASEGGSDSEPETVPELMVVSRARRSNAGNRMSTLLAKAAEEEQWGEEWEEAPNEEEFVGDDANDQDDFNLDSSESDEGEDDGRDDDAGEKELRKAERQDKIKRRKTATNPFTARLAAAAAASRKNVKLNVPRTDPSAPVPRPKKKSERASWIPTEEDGPIRTSKRKQTVANKESTLAKLKEKDKRRDDTLAMMKAAEARKAKHEPKAMTQAERLAEAARVERKNSKSLHRWEEAEEQRAADRQAKIDALKNRQIEGPFIRYYSGPAIWVDDKLKYTGKDAPKIEELEEKLNKDDPSQTIQSENAEQSSAPQEKLAQHDPSLVDQSQTSQSFSQIPPPFQPQSSLSHSEMPQISQGLGQSDHGGSYGAPYPNTVMFPLKDTFLYGIEQYVEIQNPSLTQTQNSHSQMYPPQSLPQNPFLEHPTLDSFGAFQPPFSQPHSLNSDSTNAQSLLSTFQPPVEPAAPPRRKTIRRALRNLLILSSFTNLDDHVPSRSRTTTATMKDKDRSSLIQLSSALFNWSIAESTLYINAMLTQPKSITKREKDMVGLPALKPKTELCAISNQIARYRDPATGITYRDARAYGVIRAVLGGGFQWSGSLGCYVGPRSKSGSNPNNMRAFMSMQPAVGVPKRFLEMPKAQVPVLTPVPAPVMETAGASFCSDVKMEDTGTI